MKPSKIQLTDEAGRSMAQKRYGSIGSESKHGHSQMGHSVSGKYEMARGGNINIRTDYGDPVGPVGETDSDFSEMDEENRAASPERKKGK